MEIRDKAAFQPLYRNGIIQLLSYCCRLAIDQQQKQSLHWIYLVHNKNSLSMQSYCYCYGFAENYMLEGAEARLKESPTTKIFQLLRIIFGGLSIEFF